MKKIISFSLAAVLTTTSASFAQKTQLDAFITKANGKLLKNGPVYVEKIVGGQLWYREKPNAVDIKPVKIATLKSVYLSRPQDFVDAVEQFENRNYEAALTAFRAVKEKYNKFSDIDNSLPALSGLYELDCLRKLKQYDKLSAAEKVFAKGKYLTRESHKKQLEIYKLWTASRDKDNFPLIIKQYETKWMKIKLPNYLRAQIEFVYGIALEGVGKNSAALIAYSKATNADFSGSEVLSVEAMYAMFELLEKDEDAKAVRKLWDRNKKEDMKLKLNTVGYRRLLEAGAMVRIHDKLGLSGLDSIGKSISLPDKFNQYKKYTREAGEKFLVD